MLLHVEIIFYLILGQIKYIVNFNSFSYTCTLPSYVFWSVLVNIFRCLTFTTFFSFYPSVFLIGYFLMTCLPGHQEVHQFGFTYTDILTFILPINLFSYFVFFNSRISIFLFFFIENVFCFLSHCHNFISFFKFFLLVLSIYLLQLLFIIGTVIVW